MDTQVICGRHTLKQTPKTPEILRPRLRPARGFISHDFKTTAPRATFAARWKKVEHVRADPRPALESLLKNDYLARRLP